MRSKKLQRQIKKTFGSDEFESELKAFASNIKAGQPIPNLELWVQRFDEMSNFLDGVDNSYSQNETMLELANRSLEVSTKELYEANENFRLINRAITAMVNSLDEGFLVIDKDGRCGSIVSLAAKNFIGREPVGEHLAKILNIQDDDLESFNEWLPMVFNEIIPFEDLIELAPKVLTGRLDPSQKIEIKFKPIRNVEDNSIIEIVVILIDVSEKAEAERKLGEQKLFTDMVIKYLNNKSNFVRLIQMTRETAQAMKNWEFLEHTWKEQFVSLSRELHTLKGGLNTLSIYALGYKIHQTEDEVLSFCKSPANLTESNNLVRLLGQELDDSVSEFLEKHKRVFSLDNKSVAIKEVPIYNIYKFCSELLKTGLTDLLKFYVDEIVAVPFATLFAPIEANIYSQAITQDKQIDFVVNDPQKLKVIPEFYTILFEQLVHIFNNILDHGVETTEERQAVNKDLVGKVVVDIDVIDWPQSKSKAIDLKIADDGRGIDPAKIRQKLIQRGFDGSMESDATVINHIFDHGFTTKDKANSTSGRGIGMSAVLEVVQGMGGKISVTSRLGKGTQFSIQVPLVRELNESMMDWMNKNGSISMNPGKKAS